MDGSMTNQHGLTIERVRPGSEAAALAFLFRKQSAAEREQSIEDLRGQAERGEARFEPLLTAEHDLRVVGVQLTVRHGTHTCFVWPPVVDESDEFAEEAADELLSETRRHLESADVRMAQVMLEVDDRMSARRAERNGFSCGPELHFMHRTLLTPVPAEPSPTRFETYDARTNHHRFARMLSDTYVGTRDCPGFGNHRDVEETLEGHRECGEFSPERWTLLVADDRDVGVLLLADHPSQNTWEVVYVGVHHEHRGHGYGRVMLLHGLRSAQEAGRESVLLAVDAENDVATRVYEELGFVTIARRRVHVWFAEGA